MLPSESQPLLEYYADEVSAIRVAQHETPFDFWKFVALGYVAVCVAGLFVMGIIMAARL